MRKLYLLMIACFLLPLSSHAARKSATGGAETDDNYRFGLKLYEDKDYGRSITELERFRFLKPDSAKSEDALRHIAGACYHAGQWKEAVKNLREYVKAYPATSWSEQAEFYLAESLYQQDDNDEVGQRFRQFADQRAVSPMANLALARLACLELKARHWMEAGAIFDKLAASSLKDGYQAKASGLAKASREGAELGHKSPVVAVLASAVIPGLGQAYAGKWRRAGADFVAVGGLGCWASWLFSQDQNTSALVVAGFGVLAYLSNLYGAGLSVESANRDQPRHQADRIFKEIKQVPAPQPEVMLPLVRLSFR